jgi:bacteriocin biosynthesis cyclodehydratase domain-containing protein
MEKFVLFFEGAFGRDVAARISHRDIELKIYRLTASCEQFEAIAAGATFVGVALWRRYTRECDRLDDVCHKLVIPWSGAVLDGSRLFSGPLITRESGPCFACYRRRWFTHTASPEREAALEQAYAGNPNLGPAGFAPSAAAVAAAGLLLDYKDRHRAGGRLRQLNLLTGDIQDTHVVRIHACPRCSSMCPGERYVNRLVPELAEVLK